MKKFWVCAYLVIGIIVGVGISLFMNKKTCIKTEKIKAGFSITHELLIDHGLIHSLMFQKKASFLQNKTDTSINKLIENEFKVDTLNNFKTSESTIHVVLINKGKYEVIVTPFSGDKNKYFYYMVTNDTIYKLEFHPIEVDSEITEYINKACELGIQDVIK